MRAFPFDIQSCSLYLAFENYQKDAMGKKQDKGAKIFMPIGANINNRTVLTEWSLCRPNQVVVNPAADKPFMKLSLVLRRKPNWFVYN